MYRCDKCNTVVPAGRKLNRVVTETRQKSYAVFKQAKGKGRQRFTGAPEPVANATGWEIAKELEVCAACAAAVASADDSADNEATAAVA